jgi:hypothetical protein
VQGRLRNEDLDYTIETSCAQSGRQIQIQMDSDLHFGIRTESAKPLIFFPSVDFSTLEDDSIIDAF